MSILGEYLQRVKAERDEAVKLVREYRDANDERGPMFWCGLNQKADAFLSRYDLPDDYDEA